MILSRRNKRRILNRFKNIKIDKNNCFLWRGSTSGGYGQITINYKVYYCHRIAYILFKGKIPEYICVLHKCDNKLCINPDHLFLGTDKDNMQDRDNKNRQVKGEKHGSSKLIKNNVKEILQTKNNDLPYIRNSLAIKFNVTRGAINHIINKRQWKHI